MSELTIHHLARRLPYGLIISCIDCYLGKKVDCLVYSVYRNKKGDDMAYVEYDILGEKYTGTSWDFKPYLRPLSDLVKPIEHGGEVVNVLHQMLMMSEAEDPSIYINWVTKNDVSGWHFIDESLFNAPAFVIDVLLHYHFVIDEPKGSYIEVTESNNPYK